MFLHKLSSAALRPSACCQLLTALILGYHIVGTIYNYNTTNFDNCRAFITNKDNILNKNKILALYA